MGILRTDKISGLETPTAVTGSVVFDGDGDFLDLEANSVFALGTGDFTIEGWVNISSFALNNNRNARIYMTDGPTDNASGNLQVMVHQTAGALYLYSHSSDLNLVTNGILTRNEWNHFAVCRSGTTLKSYVNGIESSSSTYSTSITANSGSPRPRIGSIDADGGELTGYISNLRVLKGTALYTADFTPPTHELEVIGDTVLLCCNNPDSAGAEATGKTITVNGDAAASTFSPGLTRDFTSGTEFKGVTTFDTQGYFVPPSGTTEQRNSSGTRAFSLGGYYTPVNYIDDIYYINVESTGNSLVFGELGLGVNHVNTGTSDSTRGISAGGSNPAGRVDNIEFITMASTGNSIDFGGDLTDARYGIAPGSNGTRGIFAGGNIGPAGPSVTDIIDYITIQSTGVDAQDFGDLQTARQYPAGSACSPTRHVIVAGQEGSTTVNTIDYITMSTLGNSADFGDLSNDARNQNCGGISSSSVRGIIMGGSAPGVRDHIEYITIATLGNSQDFGNLPSAGSNAGNASSKTRAIRMGNASPSYLNTISYVQIASTGDAMDFGDLNATVGYQAACSNGHGGLS
jgi:hypothetical protein